MRRLPAALAALLAVALLLPPIQASADSLGTVGAGLRLDGCPATASICHYRLPAATQAARDACYQTAADTQGVPIGSGYVAWWHTADTAARADWDGAVRSCQARHRPAGGKWSWSHLVFVGAS